MKRYRWVCPQCGVGKNLGARPRANATARFCIACSERGGILVERVAPKLVARRAAGRERSKAKQQKKRQTARHGAERKGSEMKLSKKWVQHSLEVTHGSLCWLKCAGARDALRSEPGCECGTKERHTHCPGCGGVAIKGDWAAKPIATYTMNLGRGHDQT